MNPHTGEIFNLSEDQCVRVFGDQIQESENEASRIERLHSIKDQLVALDNKEAEMLEKLDKRQRKNWMRNQPCPCGSGNKFKKCCWSKFA